MNEICPWCKLPMPSEEEGYIDGIDYCGCYDTDYGLTYP